MWATALTIIRVITGGFQLGQMFYKMFKSKSLDKLAKKCKEKADDEKAKVIDKSSKLRDDVRHVNGLRERARKINEAFESKSEDV